jgi:hypothetical protein
MGIINWILLHIFNKPPKQLSAEEVIAAAAKNDSKPT